MFSFLKIVVCFSLLLQVGQLHELILEPQHKMFLFKKEQKSQNLNAYICEVLSCICRALFKNQTKPKP